MVSKKTKKLNEKCVKVSEGRQSAVKQADSWLQISVCTKTSTQGQQEANLHQKHTNEERCEHVQ